MTRRRALRLLAGVAGVALTGPSSDGVAGLTPRRWRGTALGAQASLTIYHPDAARAEALTALALAEIERLEGVFSLYRANSALSRLNADGRLDLPPLELVALLDRARRWSALTAGAFDVTVQPLWALYRSHFAARDAPADGPGAADLARVRRLVDYRAVAVGPRRIAFAKAGMAITLNGIAQGYITDRVADLLRAEGLAQVLVDLGEVRALGRRPDGRAWRVGVAGGPTPGGIRDTLEIADLAVATSATAGLGFDPHGRFHHLLDPRTARPSNGLLAASVVAQRAADADACSTAILASPGALSAILGDPPAGLSKIVIDRPDGGSERIDLTL